MPTAVADMGKPKVFISYCQQPAEVSTWVRELGEALSKEGFEPQIDTKDNTKSQPIPEWVREALESSEFVVLVCTSQYAEKAKTKAKTGYVRDELRIIEGRWTDRGDQHGIFPIVREYKDKPSDVVPDICRSRKTVHLDFSDDRVFPDRLKDLVVGMRGLIQDKLNSEGGSAEGEFAKSDHGIILMADVVGFTHYRWNEQERIMQRLLSFSDDIKKKHGGLVTMPMLDGVTMIWRDETAFEAACQTAMALIQRMEENNPSVVIRTGLHIGSYSKSKNKKTQPVYFGNALNDCRRICQVGDFKHIMLSESFCLGWQGRHNSPLHEKIYPPLKESPIEVYPWRRDAGKIRLLRRGDDRLPEELYVRELASQCLSQLIDDIGKLVTKHIEKRYGVAARKQNVRVTLWAPNPSKSDELAATAFRWPEKKDTKGPASKTVYKITGEGEPPAGRAFCLPHDVFVRNKLPKAMDNLSEYIRKLGNTDPETVKNFSRHSRTYLCFAFPMIECGGEEERRNGSIDHPFGVVCIDIEHPLPKARDAELKRFTHNLRQTFEHGLTLAWRDRT